MLPKQLCHVMDVLYLYMLTKHQDSVVNKLMTHEFVNYAILVFKF